MFGATMAGDNTFFKEDGTSTFAEPGWVKGITFLTDLYKNGYAPKDSVNWGFNEIVAGFYSGTCAMLDQDPDALIAIAERMKHGRLRRHADAEGPGRQDLPDHRLCRLVDVRQQREQGPGLEADRHARRHRKATSTGTSASARCRSTRRPRTIPSTPSRQFKGWFEELADKDVVPTVMPTYLEEFAFFKDSIGVKTSQEALLGDSHAGGPGQAMGRLPDQGPAEVSRQEVSARDGRRPAGVAGRRQLSRDRRREDAATAGEDRRMRERLADDHFCRHDRPAARPQQPWLQPPRRRLEPYLYSAPALILIAAVMLVPLAHRHLLCLPRYRSCSIRSAAALSASIISATLIDDRRFFSARSTNTLLVDRRLGRSCNSSSA